jgi:hypothetical protein
VVIDSPKHGESFHDRHRGDGTQTRCHPGSPVAASAVSGVSAVSAVSGGTSSLGNVEFSREIRDDVVSGDITVSFRLWRRPKVRVGARYPVGPVHIEVDSIELIPFSSISLTDVRLSGEDSLESLRRRAAHAGPITDDTLVYRVEFHIADGTA